MKPTVLLLLPLAGLLAPHALAQPWPGGPPGPQRGDLVRPAPPPGTPLAPDRGEYRDMRNPGEVPRGDRMSPDERRQLRRDINDAGRELYREPPGRHWRRGPGF
jgi:hypothetical protein